MKSASTGAASGCFIWLFVFVIVSVCLCPLSVVAAGITSATNTELVERVLGARLCPDGTTPHIATYETTSYDSDGVERPTTGYELQCLDAGGGIVENRGGSYALIWTALIGGVGLGVSALVALALAAPAGALFARYAGRKSKPAVT